MSSYILGRLLRALGSLVAVVMIVFAMTRLSGDVTLLLLPTDATAEEVARLRSSLLLDQPIPYQFLNFLWMVIHGDFGDSYIWQTPALGLVLRTLPATLELAAAAFLFGLLVSVPIGVLSAVWKDSFFDQVVKLLALTGQAIPGFWLGQILILIFAVNLNWLPTAGRGGFAHLILPAVTLGWYFAASQSRLIRSAMLETLRQDYITFAHVKGVPRLVIIWKHALKNAALPVVTMLGVQLSTLLGGAVVTETIFAWPGIGRTMVEAILSRDYVVVQAAILFTPFAFIMINLGVDLLYGVLDPRVRIAGPTKSGSLMRALLSGFRQRTQPQIRS